MKKSILNYQKLIALRALCFILFCGFAQFTMATNYYVVPGGSGNQSGSDWDNAKPGTEITTIANAMSPGDILYIGGGNYANTGEITINTSGSSVSPKTIKGVDRDNGLPVFTGGWTAGGTGSNGLCLENNASYWNISDLKFQNVNTGVLSSSGGTRYEYVNLTNVDVHEAYTGYFLNWVFNWTIDKADVTRYIKNGIRLNPGNVATAMGAKDVTISNSLCDGTQGDLSWQELTDNYIMGFFIQDYALAEDITYRNCISKNNMNNSSLSYPNGDGFCSEGTSNRISYYNCQAYNNQDGGWDSKSSNLIIDGCVSFNNYRNFRFWNNTATITNSLTGYADNQGIWMDGHADISNVTFVGNAGPAISYDDGGTANLSNCIFWNNASNESCVGCTYDDPNFVNDVGKFYEGVPSDAYNSQKYPAKGYYWVSDEDDIAPSVPDNLATSDITQTSFTLTWSASTDNVGVTGYEVFRDGVSVGTSTNTSKSISGLTCNTSYSMTVKARDAAGNWSAASAALAVSTSVCDTQAPSAPTNLAASNITETSFTLTWTASTDNVGVTEYEVFRDGVSVGTSTNTSKSISGLTCNTSYSMTVKARDAAGNWSAASAALAVSTSACPVCSDEQTLVTCKKTTSAITIDGNLNEAAWCISNTVNKSVIGTKNNTMTFGVLWDDTYLYVGAQVLDGNLYNESTNIWDDDAVEIYIDANHNAGTTYDSYDRQYIKGYNDATLFEKNGSTTGVLHSTALVAGGFAIELAIPWSNLGITPTNNMIIGFDIGNDDDDNGGTRDNQSVWNGTSDNWTNTSAFGDLKLSDVADTQSPTAPTNLAASNITETSYTLSWTASTDNVGVTEYEVFRNGVSVGTSTTTSKSISGLTCGTSNSMTVKARDAAGNWSAASTALEVSTSACDTQAPNAPTNLAASGITTTSFTLSWTASTDNVGVTGYEVFADGVSKGTTASTSLSITGLTCATSYSMTVKARDAAGNWSAASEALAVSTSACPACPDEQTLVTCKKTGSAITIDGNLNEASWCISNNVNKSVIGTKNNTMTFGVIWDDTYLYVGAQVLDGNLYNESTNIWDDDAVEIYIDANHNAGTTYDSYDRQYIKGYNDATLFEKNGSTTGVLHSTALVTGGFTIEFAIPWSNLAITPANNMIIGFDIGNDDDDDGGTRDNQSMWNGTSNNYTNTSAFGDLKISTEIIGGPVSLVLDALADDGTESVYNSATLKISGSDRLQMGWWRFDCSSIPSNASIVSATLSYTINDNGCETLSIHAFDPVDDNWLESSEPNPLPGTEGILLGTSGTDQGRKNIDVSSGVVLGNMVTFQYSNLPNGCFGTMYSKDYSVDYDRPKLSIEYNILKSGNSETIISSIRNNEQSEIIIYPNPSSDEQSEIIIYPNPSSEKVHVIFEGKVFNIEIYSINGKLLFNKNNISNELEIDSKELTYKGISLVKIITEDTIFSRKVIFE